MAEPKHDRKPLKVMDAEITEDGCIVVTFNAKFGPFHHTKKALFMPEALHALVEEYGVIPPADDG
ncbi:MAG TPA: hypothetical protein VEA41_23180, partial [Salinarimonas sp.]|nr:hypothetical protein [Salinarimonas sp.]